MKYKLNCRGCCRNVCDCPINQSKIISERDLLKMIDSYPENQSINDV